MMSATLYSDPASDTQMQYESATTSEPMDLAWVDDGGEFYSLDFPNSQLGLATSTLSASKAGGGASASVTSTPI